MQLHLTTGTTTYLESLKDKNPEVNMGAMGEDAILYYEDDKRDSIFSSRKTYALDKSEGQLDENYPTSLHFIPVAEIRKAITSNHLADLHTRLGKVSGVQSHRIGGSVSDDTFIVLIQWAEASTYNDFKQTDDYRSYLSPDALKKFRTAESLFHQSISSKLYLPVKDNVVEPEDGDEF